jgi:hypothetical protein
VSLEEVQRKEAVARAARARAEALRAEAEAAEAEAALLGSKNDEAGSGAAMGSKIMDDAHAENRLGAGSPQRAVPPPPGTPPSSGIFSADSERMNASDQMPVGYGSMPANVLTLLMSDPELMKRMQNPKV